MPVPEGVISTSTGPVNPATPVVEEVVAAEPVIEETTDAPVQ